MNIKVLGSGCAKCVKLAANAQKAIADSGIEATVEKVTDIKAIIGYGVMTTPALVINEKVVSTGKVLSPADISQLISKGI